MPRRLKCEETTPRIVIVGAGFGGLCMAIELKRAGIDSFTIFEKSGDVGGVWAANTYPGAACDVPSHLYEFSFAPNPGWSRRFAPQAEIHAYLRSCAERFGVLEHLRCLTELASAQFLDGVWVLTTAEGETFEADILIPAMGQLSRPAIPPIPGRESFTGPQFHSAHWDHDIDLTGKHVAVLGTGASAVQFVPHLAATAAKVTVFQLDPPHVLPKPDYRYPPAARRILRRFPVLQRLSRLATYWTLELRALGLTRLPWLTAPYTLRTSRHLRRGVTDAGLRRDLAPKGQLGCTRVLMSNDWYPTLDRDHVHVVTDPVTMIGPYGPATADRTYEADALIYGTGFTATDFLSPVKIRGIGGRDLREAWAQGAEAYLGITVSGFPNLFMMYGPNTNLGHSSIVFMHESQARYILQAVRLVHSHGGTLDVRPDVQGTFNARVQERIKATVWDRGCTSWYKTPSGKNTNNWPGFTFAYRRATRSLNPADYTTRPRPEPSGEPPHHQADRTPQARPSFMRGLNGDVETIAKRWYQLAERHRPADDDPTDEDVGSEPVRSRVPKAYGGLQGDPDTIAARWYELTQQRDTLATIGR